MTTDATRTAPRSRFITVIAWLTIVGSAIAIMPLGLAALALPLIAATESAPLMPTLAALVVACIAQFVTGIGLLQRRNWARIAMIALLVITCVWQGSELLVSGDAAALLPDSLSADPAVTDLLDMVHNLMIALSLAIIVGSLWLIYRLMRADVRSEFSA